MRRHEVAMHMASLYRIVCKIKEKKNRKEERGNEGICRSRIFDCENDIGKE